MSPLMIGYHNPEAKRERGNLEEYIVGGSPYTEERLSSKGSVAFDCKLRPEPDGEDKSPDSNEFIKVLHPLKI